jgi:hypothetical protein
VLLVQFLSRPRRPRLAGEWTHAKAVTFVVTLAAFEAGMSRKSAYALKDRDCAFAKAWSAALKAWDANRRKGRSEGDTSDSSDNPRISPARRNRMRAAAAWNPLIDDARGAMRDAESARRDSFFASLAVSLDSAPLAARRSRQ